MRNDFNEIINGINGAIKRAVDRFGDPKIQYLDINPAFNDHRFCEPGHTFADQLNGSKKVWLWNSPARQFVAIRNGSDTKVYEAGFDPSDTTHPPPPPTDEFSYLLDYPEGEPQLVNDRWLTVYRDPKDAYHSMELRGVPEDYSDASSGSNGYIARTLHPTQDGHKAMGDIISQHLTLIYRCPSGCTCFASGFISCT
ncbi:hypothetical protein BDW02DRAFT_647904 [Decorospora gaudefroyi]|uniref:Uncharacterized protein n=1 Tax=Decorospora gaudefroyi TaxID=184978 RepID=A0A6A5KHS0_9PLEO|nr:hypothetical protein BDW02DRAFT_647904 [Decorospora gaudefroyi]